MFVYQRILCFDVFVLKHLKRNQSDPQTNPHGHGHRLISGEIPNVLVQKKHHGLHTMFHAFPCLNTVKFPYKSESYLITWMCILTKSGY